MLPLSALLGTMTAMHSMARNLEITTVRCAGISLLRIFAYLLPVALALAAVQFAIAERVLPQTENALKEWWSATAPSGEASTRSGPTPIAARSRSTASAPTARTCGDSASTGATPTA